ncbi:hypothetical protein [Pseudomonas putida]
MTIFKKVKVFSVAIVVVIVAAGGEFCRQLNREADFTLRSPNGDYLIESVTLGGVLFPFHDKVFLRVVDATRPGDVYRTPLYAASLLDMRSPFETEGELSITWVTFHKTRKSFSLGVPEWRGTWLNPFVANAPYDVTPND